MNTIVNISSVPSHNERGAFVLSVEISFELEYPDKKPNVLRKVDWPSTIEAVFVRVLFTGFSPVSLSGS